MRPILAACACVLLCAVAVPWAYAADHCAPTPTPLAKNEDLGLAVAVGAEHASYATERFLGNYSGLHLGLSYAPPAAGRPLWDVALDVPAYQLVRNGQDELGLGDPFARARLRLWQTSSQTAEDARGALAFGLALGVSVPLGDASADLGMGHFMVHPGLWLGMVAEKVRTEWTFGYGGVLGAEHAHDTGPLVNPMNASELAVGGALVWTVLSSLELRAAGMGAAPVGALGGEARASASFGLGLQLGNLQLGSNASFPLVGDPFQQKIEITTRYAF